MDRPYRRLAIREGIIKSTYQFQAPSSFVLHESRSRRRINFLSTQELGLNLKPLKGRRITVTGEEFVDPRWPSIPVLEIKTIELQP